MLTVYVDRIQVERLARIREEMGKRNPILDVNRSEVTRAVLERGMDALERELQAGAGK